MADYHDFEIWHRGMSLAVRVYQRAASLPAAERYNLAEQMRRAIVSVPLNIAEGSVASDREMVQFLGYAYRSLKEVRTCLELCERLYPGLDTTAVAEVARETDEVARMIYSFISRVRARSRRRSDTP